MLNIGEVNNESSRMQLLRYFSMFSLGCICFSMANVNIT